MCLGIPGNVVDIYQPDNMKMGKLEIGGVIKETCLEFVPDIQVGEYTIIHVGFGISKLDEEEAQRTLEMLREMEMLADELPELDEGLPA